MAENQNTADGGLRSVNEAIEGLRSDDNPGGGTGKTEDCNDVNATVGGKIQTQPRDGGTPGTGTEGDNTGEPLANRGGGTGAMAMGDAVGQINVRDNT